MTVMRVAAVQATYELMNREATLDRVADLTAAAAGQGAQLVVFPEVFVPGTPVWIDTQPIWDGDADWFGLLAENAMAVPGPATDRLGAIARKHGVWLVIGVEEREPNGATIYNTLLYLSPEGALVEKHRKLVPTGAERTVWGMGDGAGLRAVATAAGHIGGLICWEHWMPLARQALHESGEAVHVAAWPMVKEMALVASRHYAFEGRCHVLAAGALLAATALPAGLEVDRARVPEDAHWVLRGGSAIIAPDGRILAGPVHDRECVLTAEIDAAEAHAEAMTLDVTGHYARPDVLALVRAETRRDAGPIDA
jgi:nitrilase